MKKILAILLALMMTLGLVPALAEAPVEVTILLEGNNVSDDAAVMDKLNAYLADKIGVTVKPIWGTWADFDDKAVNAINSGDSSIDMMFTCSWTKNEYAQYAKEGAYIRLDDPADDLLAQYGQEMTALLPEVLMEGAVVEGADGAGIYAVPGFKDFATINSWDINVTLLEKYGYTLDDIKNTDFFGFGDIMAKVKAGEGDAFYPMYTEGAVMERMVTGTPIVNGDSNLLLSYYMDPQNVSEPGKYGVKLFNKYATEEYKAFVEKAHEYYEAGYIHPSLAIAEQATDTWRTAQNNAEYLISSEVTLYGYEFTTSEQRGIEVAYVYCNEPYIDNTSVQGAMIAISANSAHPVECMKFLNLLNTDPYVMTLMNYGIEGVHYNLNDKGEVEFTDERTNKYTVWTNGLGNVTLLPPTKGQGSDFQQKFAEFYAGSKKLPIYGFTFDPSNVQNEVAACVNVTEAYALTLNMGAADPATVLPEFLQKLEDAGIQKIVDEANAQLEAFLAAK